jgi:hypothetical protein
MSGAGFIGSRKCWSADFIEEAELSCNDLPEELRILWKEAGTERPMFSPDQFRRETEKMRARRRKGEIVMGVCLAAFVASYAAILLYIPNNTLTRIGSILSVFVSGSWLADILVKRMQAVPDPGETDSVRFYRAELERMRDNQRGMVWRCAILAPPFILWDIGYARIFAKLSPFLAPFMWFDGALLLAFFAIFVPLKNLRLARKVRGRIDAVDAAIRSGGR